MTCYPNGLYLFSDIELLHGSLKFEVMTIFKQLQQHPDRYSFLNHPERSLSRFPLLTSLYANGSNLFNIYPINVDLSSLRFPVFLRKTNNHSGPQTSLLSTREQIQHTLEDLRLKKENLDEWVVTEFCDVSDEQGIFRKYSSFIVDRTIIPRHIFFDTDWVQKEERLYSREFLREELAFLNTNLFKDQLLNIFDLAHISYGRIDFGILNGKVQTWEINTNPIIISPRHIGTSPRLDIHKIFFKHFSSVLHSLSNQPLPCPA